MAVASNGELNLDARKRNEREGDYALFNSLDVPRSFQEK